MTTPSSSILRDAAAPLLLLAAIAAAGVAAMYIWVAAMLADPGPVPALSLDLPLRLARDGVADVVSPAASTTAFVTTLAVLVGVELAGTGKGGRLS